MTDGKSNDPTTTGITLKNQKQRFANKNATIYALGVGGINAKEIRMLTDQDPNNLFYIMSWQDLDQFLSVTNNLMSDRVFNPETCIPTELDQDFYSNDGISIEDAIRNTINSDDYSPDDYDDDSGAQAQAFSEAYNASNFYNDLVNIY